MHQAIESQTNKSSMYLDQKMSTGYVGFYTSNHNKSEDKYHLSQENHS